VFLYSAVHSETYYVSPGGNDRNAGGLHHPWRTLSKANHSLMPGDTVYIRQGTYHEDINPVRSGTDADKIVYMNYPGEIAVIRGLGYGGGEAVIALGYPGSAVGWTSISNIVIDGLRIQPTDASYGAAIFGYESWNNVIRNCQFFCERFTLPRSQAILVFQTYHTLIEHNQINGEWDLGILTSNIPRYTVIRNNTITNTIGSCIDIQTSYGEIQSMLIEKNTLSGSRVDDGIQFEHDYSIFDPGKKHGVIIRDNIICNNAENGIDLKGAAEVLIERNIIWGNRGDNSGAGNLGGGTGGITKGGTTSNQAYDILIRYNVLYDNMGGIYITNHGWIVCHNTIIGNNRSYLGPDISADAIESAPSDNLRRKPGLTGVMLIENMVDQFDRCVIKNNIIGGNHQGEIAVRTTADLSDAEIDGNCYYNSDGVLLVDFRSNWDWDKVTFDEMKNRYDLISGPLGEETHSFVVNHPGFFTAGDAPFGEGAFNFTLIPDAAVIDRGLFLTKARVAGAGTAIPVENARLFCDGYDIVDGDRIQIESTGEIAKIISIDYNNNVLTIDRSLNWRAGDGISLPYSGSAPDMGAFEYMRDDFLDQQQTGINYGFWFDDEVIRWQEFKPSVNILTAVDVFVRHQGNAGDVVVEIRDMDDSVLGQTVINESNVPVYDWLRVDFPEHIPVESGMKYRIFMYSSVNSPDANNRYFWRGSTSSTYVSDCDNSVSSDWPGFDFAFKTYGYFLETDVNELTAIHPKTFVLEQNYPNPFNPFTRIGYTIPENSYVMLKVYDVLGRKINVLVDEFKLMGTYQIEFDGSQLPSGLYFYQLESGNIKIVRKMILAK
jgi:hypothetical protein